MDDPFSFESTKFKCSFRRLLYLHKLVGDALDSVVVAEFRMSLLKLVSSDLFRGSNKGVDAEDATARQERQKNGENREKDTPFPQNAQPRPKRADRPTQKSRKKERDQKQGERRNYPNAIQSTVRDREPKERERERWNRRRPHHTPSFGAVRRRVVIRIWFLITTT